MLLFFSSHAFADSIFLRGGERLNGKIIAEEPAKIIFESQNLGKIEIPRDRIERMERQLAAPATAKVPSPSSTNATLSAPTPSVTNTFFPWLTPQSLAESNRFDWIQLKSGEWLKGKIKSMQEDKLEFDSEEMDVQTIDWTKKILVLYSPRLQSVRFDQGEPLKGSLWITTNEVHIISLTATNTFTRDSLVAITPTGNREKDKWSAHVSAGMSFRSGNTKEVDYNAHATLQRRTPNTRLMFDYLGNYGKLDGVQTEENHRAYGQFDYFLSRRLFVRVPYAEYYVDPLQNLDRRVTLAALVGYDLIQNRRVEWNVTAGPGWQRNWYSSVETNQSPTADSLALTFGSRFDWEVTKRLDFILEYRGQFSGRETGNNTHHALATLEFEIHKRLNLDVSFTWDRIANPETDSLGHTPSKDDFRLNLGLGVDF